MTDLDLTDPDLVGNVGAYAQEHHHLDSDTAQALVGIVVDGLSDEHAVATDICNEVLDYAQRNGHTDLDSSKFTADIAGMFGYLIHT